MDQEWLRLNAANVWNVPWKKWGPYLSDRQWGIKAESHQTKIDHDQARSIAYIWGEEGIAGISDDQQRLCFAISLWNGADPILKERLFGVLADQGNHGADVKEVYFYLDSTPTHSYMKFLYKYPQQAYPYSDLTQPRSPDQPEHELIETGVFQQDRYFDVAVEYAKDSPDDILIRITVQNRSAQPAQLRILPTLWFRNTWSNHASESLKASIEEQSAESVATHAVERQKPAKPTMKWMGERENFSVVAITHPELGRYYLYSEDASLLLFTENETNSDRLPGAASSALPYGKDSIHEFVVQGKTTGINPAKSGTKAAASYQIDLDPEETRVIRLRLNQVVPFSLPELYAHANGNPFGDAFDYIVSARRWEADAFYGTITPAVADDARLVMRQALAGLLWNKQCSFQEQTIARLSQVFVPQSIQESQKSPTIITTPDKWEYPDYDSWHSLFHVLPLAIVDLPFAKRQLERIFQPGYMQATGQLRSDLDLKPPVQAWAVRELYELERQRYGGGDVAFLRFAFHRLLLNYNWWINRTDSTGRSILEGGFLGIDWLGLSEQPIEHANSLIWLGFLCSQMLSIALELSLHDPVHQDLAGKFYEDFLQIAYALQQLASLGYGLWDETDGFLYDWVRSAQGNTQLLKVRSFAGLFPLCACTVITTEMMERLPIVRQRILECERQYPELTNTQTNASQSDQSSPAEPNSNRPRLLSLFNAQQIQQTLMRMLDETEFLSRYGIRSLSRYHQNAPIQLTVAGTPIRIAYEPGESTTGDNTNWRGAIWLPQNMLLLRSLLTLHSYYGTDWQVECPIGSGIKMDLWQVSQEIATRLVRLFLLDADQVRPVHGDRSKLLQGLQAQPLFYEYFHGEHGQGLGASHQTGWTSLIAWIIQFYGYAGGEKFSD